MTKKLFIVEEALKDFEGHYYEYLKTIAQAAQKQGWEVFVACNKNASAEIKHTFNTFPAFKYSRYLDQGKKKLPGERYYGFILHSMRCLKVLWPLLKKHPRYDVSFVPTVLVHHLIAWYIIMMFHPNKPNKLSLFFVTKPGIWDSNSKTSFFPKSTLVMKVLLKMFTKLVNKGAVVMGVDANGGKKEFEKLSGLPFKLLPHPVPVDAEMPVKQGSDDKPILFGCYGFARHEKGSDLLKKAIENILSKNPSINATFSVQWTDAFSMPDASKCEPGEILTNNPKVKIIDKAVGSEEYRQLLSETDCMVLPYRNSSYYARVSRIAIESATSSIPLIYTKHGWLEETISKYGAGIGIEDESSQELETAIEEMIGQFEKYKQLAMEQSLKARKYYSPEYFCELLLAN